MSSHLFLPVNDWYCRLALCGELVFEQCMLLEVIRFGFSQAINCVFVTCKVTLILNYLLIVCVYVCYEHFLVRQLVSVLMHSEVVLQICNALRCLIDAEVYT